MPYLLANPSYAEQLNRSIMRLLRPEHLRDEKYTDLYCTMVTHPETGYMALVLPESETVPVHIEASGDELKALMSIFVADGAVSQAEADGLADALLALGGQQVQIIDFVPPSWSPFILTKEQMDADGWFPEIEEEV